MGASHARNVGIDNSKGKFIAFLDSDDEWTPNKLEHQLRFMLDNHYPMSHTDYNRVDATGTLLKHVDLSAYQGDIFQHCLYACGIATPCVIAEREFWGSLRFPQGVDCGEDVCCWLELAWRSNWGHVPETLTSVYVNNESAYADASKQQLGYAEILRFVLSNPRWVPFQDAIGVAARDFANLFPKPQQPTLPMPPPTSPVPLFLRFNNAIKNYGAFGTCIRFLKKTKMVKLIILKEKFK